MFSHLGWGFPLFPNDWQAKMGVTQPRLASLTCSKSSLLQRSHLVIVLLLDWRYAFKVQCWKWKQQLRNHEHMRHVSQFLTGLVAEEWRTCMWSKLSCVLNAFETTSMCLKQNHGLSEGLDGFEQMLLHGSIMGVPLQFLISTFLFWRCCVLPLLKPY